MTNPCSTCNFDNNDLLTSCEICSTPLKKSDNISAKNTQNKQHIMDRAYKCVYESKTNFDEAKDNADEAKQNSNNSKITAKKSSDYAATAKAIADADTNAVLHASYAKKIAKNKEKESINNYEVAKAALGLINQRLNLPNNNIDDIKNNITGELDDINKHVDKLYDEKNKKENESKKLHIQRTNVYIYCICHNEDVLNNQDYITLTNLTNDNDKELNNILKHIESTNREKHIFNEALRNFNYITY
jgi:hypothetical protein